MNSLHDYSAQVGKPNRRSRCRIKGCECYVAKHETPDMAGLCSHHQERQADRWAQNGRMSQAMDNIWRGHERGRKEWGEVVGRMSESIVDVLLRGRTA